MSTKIQFVKHEFSTLPGDIPIVIDNSLPTECLIIRTKSHDLLIDFKTGKSTRTKRPTFEPIPDYGTLMTWSDFVRDAKDGMIDDDDGSGSLATATQVSDIDISLARARSTPPFPWVTHVHWCGK